MKKLALVSFAVIGLGLSALGCASKQAAESTETTTQVAPQATETQQQMIATEAPQTDAQSQGAAVATDPAAQIEPAQHAPMADDAAAQSEQ